MSLDLWVNPNYSESKRLVFAMNEIARLREVNTALMEAQTRAIGELTTGGIRRSAVVPREEMDTHWPDALEVDPNDYRPFNTDDLGLKSREDLEGQPI